MSVSLPQKGSSIYTAMLQPKERFPIQLGQTRSFQLAIQPSPHPLEIEHDRPLHMFVVSQDLSDFQHVHPDVQPNGTLEVPLQLNKTGPYHWFVQFKPKGQSTQTLRSMFQVQGQGVIPYHAAYQPFQADNHLSKHVGNYRFSISNLPTRQQPEGMFRIDISDRQGQPVQHIKPHLGAAGHCLILSQDLAQFIHTHPMEMPQASSSPMSAHHSAPDKPLAHHPQQASKPTGNSQHYPSPIAFHTRIEKPGPYKLWVQFNIDDKIHTVDWSFWV